MKFKIQKSLPAHFLDFLGAGERCLAADSKSSSSSLDASSSLAGSAFFLADEDAAAEDLDELGVVALRFLDDADDDLLLLLLLPDLADFFCAV